MYGLYSMTPREQAQIQAEKAFEGFMGYFQRIVIVCIVSLIFIALVSDFKTPTNYNGEAYAPMNVGKMK